MAKFNISSVVLMWCLAFFVSACSGETNSGTRSLSLGNSNGTENNGSNTGTGSFDSENPAGNEEDDGATRNAPGDNNNQPVRATYGPQAIELPGKIQVEEFDKGGQGLAYNDLDTQNSGGQLRTSEGVDVSNFFCSDQHTVSSTRPGEWLKYTVQVTQAGDYYLSARFRRTNAGSRIRIEVDENDSLGAIALPATGDSYRKLQLSNTKVNLPAGSHSITLLMDADGGSGNVAEIDFIEFHPENRAQTDGEIHPMRGALWEECYTGYDNNGNPTGKVSDYNLSYPVLMQRGRDGSAPRLPQNAYAYKILHPGCGNDATIMASQSAIRQFAQKAMCEGYEGVALDLESSDPVTTTHGPDGLRWFYEEIDKFGGKFIVVPKISLEHQASQRAWNRVATYDYKTNWRDLPSNTRETYTRRVLDAFEDYTHAASPWIYGYNADQYLSVVSYWETRGYSKQIFPMGDAGKRGPSGGYATEAEALESVRRLADEGYAYAIFNPRAWVDPRDPDIAANLPVINAMRQNLDGID